jgi:DNA polymerase IV
MHWHQVAPAVEPLCAKVWAACLKGGHAGRTVVTKVKYADFQQITRSRSSIGPIGSYAELERISLELLRPCFPPPRGIRLLGVTVSGFDARDHRTAPQLALPLGPAT